MCVLVCVFGCVCERESLHLLVVHHVLYCLPVVRVCMCEYVNVCFCMCVREREPSSFGRTSCSLLFACDECVCVCVCSDVFVCVCVRERVSSSFVRTSSALLWGGYD